jgi:hypothetical protein
MMRIKFLIVEIIKLVYSLPLDCSQVIHQDEEIDFDQFMDFMTKNIIRHREKFGSDKVVFESGKYII